MTIRQILGALAAFTFWRIVQSLLIRRVNQNAVRAVFGGCADALHELAELGRIMNGEETLNSQGCWEPPPF